MKRRESMAATSIETQWGVYKTQVLHGFTPADNENNRIIFYAGFVAGMDSARVIENSSIAASEKWDRYTALTKEFKRLFPDMRRLISADGDGGLR